MALAAVLLCSAAAWAQPWNQPPGPSAYQARWTPCLKQSFTPQKHRTYTRKVYSRTKVTREAQRRVRRMTRCQPSYRDYIRALRYTRKQRNRYKAKKARQPYGPLDGIYFAIPTYIVACETRGYSGYERFKAVNPNNPARPAGAYQIITSTWLAFGGGRFAPTADAATPHEQHTIARRIWQQAGSGQWECA